MNNVKKTPSHNERAAQTLAERLKADWLDEEWELDDVARILFEDFDRVSGTRRRRARTDAWMRFARARVILADDQHLLIIPRAFYRGRAVCWAFAGESQEDQSRVQKMMRTTTRSCMTH
jgi:hypothetical protein